MAVVGVGVDAIEIERVAAALERTPTLVDRVFTPAEQAYCGTRTGRRRAASYAGRFAAKEAVAKALGTGVAGFTFRDVEIVNGADGAPTVVLGVAAQRVVDRLGIARVHVSLSLTRSVAVATAVAES
ncbi:MAG TPA: holo-ACP synthase [Euzebyales bacterium]